MKSIELIVRLVIKRDKKILLCKSLKNGGHYFLPGGHVEFGDSLEETVYKEMNEELGLKRQDITNILYQNYLEQTFTQDDEEHHELNMIFTADIPKDIKVTSREDHISFEWIDIKDIKNIKLLPEKIIPLIQ